MTHDPLNAPNIRYRFKSTHKRLRYTGREYLLIQKINKESLAYWETIKHQFI